MVQSVLFRYAAISSVYAFHAHSHSASRQASIRTRELLYAKIAQRHLFRWQPALPVGQTQLLLEDKSLCSPCDRFECLCANAVMPK